MPFQLNRFFNIFLINLLILTATLSFITASSASSKEKQLISILKKQNYLEPCVPKVQNLLDEGVNLGCLANISWVAMICDNDNCDKMANNRTEANTPRYQIAELLLKSAAPFNQKELYFPESRCRVPLCTDFERDKELNFGLGGIFCKTNDLLPLIILFTNHGFKLTQSHERVIAYNYEYLRDRHPYPFTPQERYHIDHRPHVQTKMITMIECLNNTWKYYGSLFDEIAHATIANETLLAKLNAIAGQEADINNCHNASLSSPPLNTYEQRKNDLLEQANNLTAYHQDILNIFKNTFDHRHADARERFIRCRNICMKLKRKLEQDALYNRDVADRLSVEINALTETLHRNYKYTEPPLDNLSDMYKTKEFAPIYGTQPLGFDQQAGLECAWRLIFDKLCKAREKTLTLWPKELQEKYPTLVIAAFLNEGQKPLLLESIISVKKPHIDPYDFLPID